MLPSLAHKLSYKHAVCLPHTRARPVPLIQLSTSCVPYMLNHPPCILHNDALRLPYTQARPEPVPFCVPGGSYTPRHALCLRPLVYLVGPSHD